MEDFKTLFKLSQTPQEIFEAIINVRGWWSEMLEGESARQGDEFIYRHGDLHYSRHCLTEVTPFKKVVWLTTDGRINFVNEKTEWAGTTVIFDITEEEDGQTTLQFTHHGLVPDLACFEACTGGWRYYLESLRSLITTGVGRPDRKD